MYVVHVCKELGLWDQCEGGTTCTYVFGKATKFVLLEGQFFIQDCG